MPKITISYRRADTDVMAGRIRDRLAAHYGEEAVFMDIDDIPYGKDFRVHIREAVVQSDVLLVIVGQRWLGAGRGGSRKIDDETDFVRFEVEIALSNAVTIIPVLVGSTRGIRSAMRSLGRMRITVNLGLAKPARSAPTRRTRGGFMTCTAMSWNGLRMIGTKITAAPQWTDRPGRTRDHPRIHAVAFYAAPPGATP